MNCYDELALPVDATTENIRQAYLKLAKERHPDKNGGNNKESFQKLCQAYWTLRDPNSRSDHDRYLNVNEGRVYCNGADRDSCSVASNAFCVTLEVIPEYMDLWISTCESYYADAIIIDRMKNGLQLKTSYISDGDSSAMGSLSLTFHRTTHRIHVQGSSYLLWLEEHHRILQHKVEALAHQAGKAIKKAKRTSRNFSRRSKTSKYLGDKEPRSTLLDSCDTCNTPLMDGDNGGRWCCYLCGASYHGLCAEPASCDELGDACEKCVSTTPLAVTPSVTPNMTPPACVDTSLSPAAGDSEVRDRDLAKLALTDREPATLPDGLIQETVHQDPSHEKINCESVCEKKSKGKASQCTKNTKKPHSTSVKKRDIKQQRTVVNVASIPVLQRTVRELEKKYVNLLTEVESLKLELAKATADKSNKCNKIKQTPHSNGKKRDKPNLKSTKPCDVTPVVLTLPESSDEGDVSTCDEGEVTTDLPLNNSFQPLASGAGFDDPVSPSTRDTVCNISKSELSVTEKAGPSEPLIGDVPTPIRPKSRPDTEPCQDTPSQHGKQLPSNRLKTPPKSDFLVVSSSIGKALEPQRLYKQKSTRIKILQKGKNINDATDFIKRTKSKASVVLFIIGSNDLSANKTVDQCLVELDGLLAGTLQHMGETTHIVLSQVLQRTDQVQYNKKADIYNKRVKAMCDNNPHLHYLTQHDLQTPSSKYDGIHLRDWAVKRLAKNIKLVVNPLLGLIPYQQYVSPNRNDRDSATPRMQSKANNERISRNTDKMHTPRESYQRHNAQHGLQGHHRVYPYVHARENPITSANYDTHGQFRPHRQHVPGHQREPMYVHQQIHRPPPTQTGVPRRNAYGNPPHTLQDEFAGLLNQDDQKIGVSSRQPALNINDWPPLGLNYNNAFPHGPVAPSYPRTPVQPTGLYDSGAMTQAVNRLADLLRQHTSGKMS